MAVEVTPRADEGGGSMAAATSGRSVTTAHDRTAGGRERVGARLVEDRPEPGVAPAGAHLVASAGDERGAVTASSTWASEVHAVGAHHLEQPGWLDHRHLRPAGEDHLTAAPRERARPRGAHPIGPSCSGVGIEASESPPVVDEPDPRPLARIAPERGGDHPGRGDR